jgi:hypothetical protein
LPEAEADAHATNAVSIAAGAEAAVKVFNAMR